MSKKLENTGPWKLVKGTIIKLNSIPLVLVEDTLVLGDLSTALKIPKVGTGKWKGKNVTWDEFKKLMNEDQEGGEMIYHDKGNHAYVEKSYDNGYDAAVRDYNEELSYQRDYNKKLANLLIKCASALEHTKDYCYSTGPNHGDARDDMCIPCELLRQIKSLTAPPLPSEQKGQV